MSRVRSLVGVCALILGGGVATAEPPTYEAIDITEWDEAQLAALPFFKRLTLVPPADAPSGFAVVAASEAGHFIGHVPQGLPYSGSEAVFLRANPGGGHTAEYIDPFGTFNWGYWSCDSKDCHYYFGYVRDSVPGDMNWGGSIVGRATVPGSGDYASDAIYHAFAYDTESGMVDLFPDDGQSRASCINNRGETAGYLAGFGAFRRNAAGDLTALDPVDAYIPSPRWINANGVIIGSRYPSRAFASPGGSTTFDLPDLGGFETVVANDLNDAGWIVGRSGNFGEQETYATIWQPEADGSWTAFDLVEQLQTPDVLLENALAIDSAGNIVARGHEDGTDLFNSRMYWLVPDVPLPGWCVPDIGRHPRDVTVNGPDAEITIDVVDDSVVTGYQWRRDGVDIPAVDNPSASTAVLVLAGLNASDSGTTYDCIVTSECGEVASEVATLTVEPACPADVSGDDVVDLADLNVVLGNFGQQTASGDTNGDGVVDLADLNSVLAAFGTPCP